MKNINDQFELQHDFSGASVNQGMMQRDISLEIFLDKNNILMRSVENNSPYFEAEYDYTPEHAAAIRDIEETREVKNKLVLELFAGIDAKTLKNGVTCHIADSRNDDGNTLIKTVVLQLTEPVKNCEYGDDNANLKEKKRNSIEEDENSGSSEESEPIGTSAKNARPNFEVFGMN